MKSIAIKPGAPAREFLHPKPHWAAVWRIDGQIALQVFICMPGGGVPACLPDRPDATPWNANGKDAGSRMPQLARRRRNAPQQRPQAQAHRASATTTGLSMRLRCGQPSKNRATRNTRICPSCPHPRAPHTIVRQGSKSRGVRRVGSEGASAGNLAA